MTKSLIEALEDKFLVDDGCWPWTGAITPDGYSQIRRDAHNLKGHRVVYELLVGPIPEGMVLDHLCRNRSCVNPGHLEPVTFAENILRGVGPTAENAAKTHCDKGHAFTSDNTYNSRPDKPHWRACRRCAIDNAKRNKRRKRDST